MIDRSVVKMASLVCSLMASACCMGEGKGESKGEAVHWGYVGESGPKHWGELSEDYTACGLGKNQSPINIETDGAVPAKLGPLVLDYRGKTTEVINNGHTIQLAVEPGSTLRVEGHEYQLLQFHFHSSSEHSIDGEVFPLELHFVHQNSAGELAVVGVLFRLGEENERIKRIGEAAPREAGSAPLAIKLTDILPVTEVADYYRYNGSLTTPPCTEGLRWYVYPSIATVSSQQIAEYIELIGYDARGIQPHNARMVLRAQ